MNNNNVRKNFQSMIRRILNEEVQKRNSMEERVPEHDGNGLDRTKDKTKTFASDENPRDIKSKDALLADLSKLVKAIDDEYLVVWDDHDDLKIDARDLMSFRITPDWEDHYEIEVMTRNEDRVWITGLDWDQVKEFVKKNLDNAQKAPTYVEKAYDKSYRNREDKTEPVKDAIKTEKVKVKTVGDTKNKDKSYNDTEVKNEDDLPDKPMKEVDSDSKKQVEHKSKEPVKLRKRTPNKTLIIKQK